jgi:hypothetical protein
MRIQGGSINNLGARRTFKGGNMRDFWFDVPPAATVQQRVVTPSSTNEVQVEDRVFLRLSGGTNVTDFSWPYTVPIDRKTTETIARSTSNAAVVIPDPNDSTKWQWIGDGSASITVSCPSRTASVSVSALTLTPATVDTLLRYATGSMRRHVNDAVDGALAGKTKEQACAIFTTQDHTNSTYVRNSNCWANYADLTPISPWNSQGGNQLAGILISPRHVLFATHYAAGAGAVMRFIKADNSVVERTITAASGLPGYGSFYPDLTVGVLNSDVPAGIEFARILPDAWATKLPSLSTNHIPCLTLDQEEKALVTDLSSITSAAGNYGAMASFSAPADAKRLEFYEEKVGGDSSNPACMIVNGQLVVLTCWTFGGAGSGTSVVYHKAAINSAMTSLGGGYQLTDADLSAFPNY